MTRRYVALAIAFTLLAGACSWETRDLVPPEEPRVAETSVVLDRNGDVLTELKAEQNRIPVDLDEVAQVLQDAVVAVEDERFYLHKGVDLQGIIRAGLTNVSSGGVSEGASTITQQYVGNVFLDRSEQTATRKIEEIILARQFEQKYSKEYILERYLNWVYFGNGAYGVEAAARRYFDTTAADVTLAQAAMLAGQIQRPSDVNPFDDRTAALERRQTVLDRMLANDYIDADQREAALADPLLDLAGNAEEDEERYDAAHFVEQVRQWFLSGPEECPDLPGTYDERVELLFTGGITITTTLDPDLQQVAEAAVNEVLPPFWTNSAGEQSQNPDAAVVTMNPANGEVLAMVGGRDFFSKDSENARVNLAVNPKGSDLGFSGRQAGSSMKPIGLAAALADGAPISTRYPAPSSITLSIPGGESWSVRGGSSSASLTLADATRYSTNTVFAQLIAGDDALITPDRFREMAGDLGIRSELPNFPSIILGTGEVNMLEMATAYGTFASDGIRHDPVMVDRILASDGTMLCRPRDNIDIFPALDQGVARQITGALQGVLEPGGTASRFPLDRPAAGKTGTTQNSADATFIGYTPDYVTSVWVGFPNGSIAMQSPAVAIPEVYGGTYPAEIWNKIMTAAHDGLPVREFPPPPSTTTTTSSTIPVAARPLVTVPDIVGLSVDEATSALRSAGLTISVFEVVTTEYAPGTVFQQSPTGGQSTRAGGAVTAQVAVEPSTQLIAVPRVNGLSEADAEGILLSAGFSVLKVYEAEGGDVAPDRVGIVWKQRPQPGTEAPTGATVEIFVNPPPAPPPDPPPDPAPTTTTTLPPE